MTNTYTVKPNELEAISLGASHDATRYYLNGVCFESYADNPVAMITIDGHRLMAVHARQADQPVNSFILGNDDVKKALSMTKGDKAPNKYIASNQRITISTDDHVSLTVSVIWLDKEGELLKTSGSFTTKAIDGNFPDWRGVVPSLPLTGPATNSIGFSGAYMADFGKASKLLSGNRNSLLEVVLTGSGSPIIVNIPDADRDNPVEFLGVLMPVRK